MSCGQETQYGARAFTVPSAQPAPALPGETLCPRGPQGLPDSVASSVRVGARPWIPSGQPLPDTECLLRVR